MTDSKEFDFKKFQDELAKQINERIEKISYLNGIIEGLLIASSFTCLVTEIDGKPVMGDRLVVRKEIENEIRKTIKKLEKIRKE